MLLFSTRVTNDLYLKLLRFCSFDKKKNYFSTLDNMNIVIQETDQTILIATPVVY